MTLYSGKRIADMTTAEIQEEIRKLRQSRTIASSASRRATAERRRTRATREPDLSALADLPPELRDEVLKALSLGGTSTASGTEAEQHVEGGAVAVADDGPAEEEG